MTGGARRVGWAVALCSVLWLGACSQSMLARLGLARPPVAVHQNAPVQPAPAAAAAVPDDREPVPAAAPREPVETERVAPPPGVRSEQKS